MVGLVLEKEYRDCAIGPGLHSEKQAQRSVYGAHCRFHRERRVPSLSSTTVARVNL